ncbi:MAG TPA: hypothetical protein VJ927_04435 [Actinomycetota bacterium]|nr:hypothetical protein [Actinomycetota bacterium]
MKDKLARIALAIALVLGFGVAAGCDAEDEADVREGVRDVQREAEDAGQEAEDAIDEADTDGKDD